MHEFLASKGWYNTGGCGCTPQKYKWKNDAHPNVVYKTCPSRNTWEFIQFDHVTGRGQVQSIQTQYDTLIASIK